MIIKRSNQLSASAVAAAAAGASQDDAAAGARSSKPTVRSLVELAAAAAARGWQPSLSLSGLPADVAPTLWRAVVSTHTERTDDGRPLETVSCAAMFPFVRHVWDRPHTWCTPTPCTLH